MSEADDERAREREVILQRRAKLVAYAVAAGVTAAACSGRTTCLSVAIGGSSSGGTSSKGGTPVTGGLSYCLNIAQGGFYGGSMSVGGSIGGSSDGGFGYCLSAPLAGAAGVGSGGVSVCLQPPLGGAAGEGAGGEGGVGGATGGTGGTAPFGGTSICLTAPP